MAPFTVAESCLNGEGGRHVEECFDDINQIGGSFPPRF